MKKSNWIKAMGITQEDAMRISRELLERIHVGNLCGLELLNECREVISLGINEYRRIKNSKSFIQVAELSLEERSNRRYRTVYEIEQICNKIRQESPEFAEKQLRDITGEQCKEALNKSFHTALQFAKARVVLHSIFACGKRNGWCAVNPVKAIPRPTIREKEITPLSWKELQQLLATAKKKEHIACLPAVGFMLWAGLRPTELMRLTWDDIDWQEKIINLRPCHTKTGGCRHVTIHPVLMAWLKNIKNVKFIRGHICPRNWINRWKNLRKDAGIVNWQQDVLRHTFASYYIKRWHNINMLQEEMGHRSSRLLMTRYLSMKGITRQQARLFWTPGKLG